MLETVPRTRAGPTMTKMLVALLILNAVILATVWILYRRARRARRERRVEGPNSEYKSRYVLDLESRERWEALDMSLLHPLNREEVEKVLDKLRATSVRALSSQERSFLDRMVEAEKRARRSAGRGRRDAVRPRTADA